MFPAHYARVPCADDPGELERLLGRYRCRLWTRRSGRRGGTDLTESSERCSITGLRCPLWAWTRFSPGWTTRCSSSPPSTRLRGTRGVPDRVCGQVRPVLVAARPVRRADTDRRTALVRRRCPRPRIAGKPHRFPAGSAGSHRGPVGAAVDVLGRLPPGSRQLCLGAAPAATGGRARTPPPPPAGSRTAAVPRSAPRLPWIAPRRVPVRCLHHATPGETSPRANRRRIRQRSRSERRAK